MSEYKKIIVAVELIDDSDEQVIAKAKKVLENNQGAELFLVHAVEYLSTYGVSYGVSIGMDIETNMIDSAKQQLAEVAKHIGADRAHQIIKSGPAKVVILDEAKKHDADLIILGSHGRHGLQLVLGSTANGVLHGAECDVLAVRLKEDEG